MIRRRFVQIRNDRGGRLAPVLTVFLLLANLLAVMAPLASCPARAGELDDTNSIIICSENGFRRVALSELEGETPSPLSSDDCADCCTFCPIQLIWHVAVEPDHVFQIPEAEPGMRLQVPVFDRVTSVSKPGWKRPRGPPTLS